MTISFTIPEKLASKIEEYARAAEIPVNRVWRMIEKTAAQSVKERWDSAGHYARIRTFRTMEDARRIGEQLSLVRPYHGSYEGVMVGFQDDAAYFYHGTDLTEHCLAVPFELFMGDGGGREEAAARAAINIVLEEATKAAESITDDGEGEGWKRATA